MGADVHFYQPIMDDARKILRDSFGLLGFRGKQEQVIRRLVVENKNALAVMPTGKHCAFRTHYTN